MSGSGIASTQGTVVFGLPASTTADPCVPPQQQPATFPVAQRSTLSPNASPFVPKNFALPVVAATPQAPFAAVAATATAPDSDMSYAPALPANVQTIYLTGLPGYYAPYVPTPTVPFYAMQYQCMYQPPPPPPPPMGVCCPMEEGSLPLADEAPPAMLGGGHAQPSASVTSLLPHPPQHQQQQQTLIIQNSGRRNKKKSRSGRRRDNASHRDCAPMGDTEACITPEYGHNSATTRNSSNSGTDTVTTTSRSSYEPGVASPDFSSSSEFPSLPVQDIPQRQSPSGISYSSALQQQKVPPSRPPLISSTGSREREAGELSSFATGPTHTRGSQQQGRRGGSGINNGGGGNNVSNADARPHKRGGGGGGARKHRRGGGGGLGGNGEGGGVGRRAEDAADAPRSQQHYYHQPPHQQERRGGLRKGKANPVATMDGEAEKHQFEAPEKNVKQELRLPRPPTDAENTSRANSAGGRSSNQGGGGGVRVNASRGRRETRHSSLLRGVLKGGAERQGMRSNGGGRKGSEATERHPTPPLQEQQQRTGENRAGTQDEDKLAPRKNSQSFVGENDSSDEYPPLGSGGTEDRSLERTPEGRMAKSDTKDTVKVQGDNIPKQQQSPREKGGKQGALVKPLVSTNSGSSGPKHKTAISMHIADIMVPKQRQPKKLKEKENLLERSSKKPEVGGWDP